jgi:hypothetical protein
MPEDATLQVYYCFSLPLKMSNFEIEMRIFMNTLQFQKHAVSVHENMKMVLVPRSLFPVTDFI